MCVRQVRVCVYRLVQCIGPAFIVLEQCRYKRLTLIHPVKITNNKQ